MTQRSGGSMAKNTPQMVIFLYHCFWGVPLKEFFFSLKGAVVKKGNR